MTRYTVHAADVRPALPLRRLLCLGWVCASILAVTSPVLADDHIVSEASGENVTPPPGTLSSEGIVPGEGFEAPTTSGGTEGAPPIEPIGHVPGPGEGVYGDPPNVATGDPETRAWAYDSDYFFAMTRGLETDTDLGEVGRRWVRPLTFTFDVITLPTAAMAGLSGKPPVEDEPTAGAEGEAGQQDESPGSDAGAESSTADDAAADGEPATDDTPASDAGESAPTDDAAAQATPAV